MAADPYRYFRVEARELLEQLGQSALDLEKGVPPGEVIPRLLRLAHTLKGAARVVKQPAIAEHAHDLEDLFAALRDSTGNSRQQQIDRVLALLDQIGGRLSALSPGSDPDTAPVIPSAPAASHEPVHVFRPEASDIEALIDGVAQAQTLVAGIRGKLDADDGLRHLVDLVGHQLVRFRGRDREASADIVALDTALSMVDEVRTRVGALQREITAGVDQAERELRQVSEVAARLRLVPASALFRFLERAARDIAQAISRPVTFEGRGGDVRVDSGILTIIQGALLQVVRNAVAHGIETSTQDRRDAGKPPDGRITVAVSRRGSWVSFVCSDDGRGIDFEAVRRVLQRRGLSAVEAQALSSDAVLQLLLAGGISTSQTVTDVSGRGVGLDVVSEAARRLGGTVSMRSDSGRGTSVEIVIPFAIASFQGLAVEVGGVGAVVPLDTVRRSLRITPGEIVETADGESLVHEGRSVLMAPLLGVIRPSAARTRLAQASSAFIIETADGVAAFTVDRILGVATVVMRPLPALLPAVPAVVGASLDSSGVPRLVLDPVSLVKAARRLGSSRPETGAVRPSILVIDDSLTTRMLEQSILESAGYDVSLAASGEEGLEKARAAAYALFLVDVEMPGIDGFAFIEQIRLDPALRQIPSILVTSRASAADRQRGSDVGAQGYIVKGDFDQGALLEQIRMLVS